MLQKEIELNQLEHSQSSAFLQEMRSKLENLVRVLREGEITREKTLSVRKFISDATKEIDEQEKNIEDKKLLLEKENSELQNEENKILQNGIKLSSLKEKKSFSSKNKKTKSRLSNSEAFKNASVLKVENSNVKKIKKQEPLKEGTEVLVGNEKRKGVLVRKVKNEIWQIQFGSMKMNFPQSQIIPLENKIVDRSVSVVIERDSENEKNNESPKFELRLLGMRAEDAIKSLEHQLDLCVINNFKKFSVIHGKGNGILQQAVSDYLNHCSSVKEFYFARPEEGGTGKTYVELF